MRCRRVLEHLFRVQSAEVFESIVDCWSKDLPVCVLAQGCVVVTHIYQGSNISPDSAFELIDVLISNAQNVVHLICESITCRISGTSEKSKRQAINPNLCVLSTLNLFGVAS